MSKVARGYSAYIDSLSNYTMKRKLQAAMPMDVYFVASHPDFLAFGMVVLMSVLVCLRVKELAFLNKLCTLVNLSVCLAVIVLGSIKIKPEHWDLDKVPSNAGVGGFFPFGLSGVMTGAAISFYCFVGFDNIVSMAEEALNPQKSIPNGILFTLLICLTGYSGIAAVQTLLVPYHLLDHPAPLPFAFEYVGWPAGKWLVTVGTLAGLSTSLLGVIFPIPRLIYAMASDGLMFECLSEIHPKLQTPVRAAIPPSVCASVLALIFNPRELSDLVAIGTLMSYSLVAISVTVLRYLYQAEDNPLPPGESKIKVATELLDMRRLTRERLIFPDLRFQQAGGRLGLLLLLKMLLNWDRTKRPNQNTASISLWLIMVVYSLTLSLSALLVYRADHLREISSICGVVVLSGALILALLLLRRQPEEQGQTMCKVPCVPFVPMISVFVNTYLMFNLPALSWGRFAVWMLIGLVVYFSYSIRHSVLGKDQQRYEKDIKKHQSPLPHEE